MLQGSASVYDCLKNSLAPEMLEGVTCELCSLRQTIEWYRAEAVKLSAAPGVLPNGSTPRTASGSFSVLDDLGSGDGTQGVSSSRKKKAKEARRVEGRLQEILDSNTIVGFDESVVPPGQSTTTPTPVKWQKVQTNSIRQTYISRPPQTLRLHFIRSEYTPWGQLVKKAAAIDFPMFLDLTPYVSNGVWEDRGNGGVLDSLGMMATPKVVSEGVRRILYRLESVILHLGYTHSSGHFVCIRRKPKPPSSSSLSPDGTEHDHQDGAYRPGRVSKSCPDGCFCEECRYFGQVRGGGDEIGGKGWLSISDADVEEVGTEALVAARKQVVLCFYERVGEFEGHKKPVLPPVLAPGQGPDQTD